MPNPSVEKKIASLRDELNRHNRLYFVEARPAISDREYDQLMHELIALEKANPELLTPDSPSQRVGGDVQSALKPVKHAVPMMSIDNTYSEAEVRAFDERVRKALGGDQPRDVLGAEDRRGQRQPPLRERRVGARGDARPRQCGRR